MCRLASHNDLAAAMDDEYGDVPIAQLQILEDGDEKDDVAELPLLENGSEEDGSDVENDTVAEDDIHSSKEMNDVADKTAKDQHAKAEEDPLSLKNERVDFDLIADDEDDEGGPLALKQPRGFSKSGERMVVKILDSYGFEVPTDSHREYRVQEQKLKDSLSERQRCWNAVLESCAVDLRDIRGKSGTRREIRRGIPSSHRAAIWLAVSGASGRMAVDKGLYSELCLRILEVHKEVVDQIEKDLPRTCPDNSHFQVSSEYINVMRRLLTVYALYDIEVGYCMNPQ